MAEDSFFLKLLESGQVVVEKGNFMFLNEFFILLPTKTFLKLRELLTKEMGKRADPFLKDLGKYQVTHALKRYSKTIKIEGLDRAKITEFGMGVMNLMGHGTFKVASFDEKKIVIKSKNVPTAVEYPLLYGKSKKPIDVFLCGLLEEAFSRLMNKKMVCTETKCRARGDSMCVFEIRIIK